MHDMRTLMTNMAPKRQFADFILDSDWLKSFRYQCYCSGWLLVVQSVRKNQQSAEKMGVFGWCACWRHQFESNISVKSFSLSNFSCTKCLQTMWGVDCGLGQRNKIVMCFTRGAIVPHWWHKKRHRARGALICNFLRVRQIGPICRTSKKSQIVSVKCDVSFDFFI